ncbi:MAG TPA: glutamate 5-kinase [Pseudomonadales bacterium]|nr:glutamate 5-kinase [Pseudomonadales bacterium]
MSSKTSRAEIQDARRWVIKIGSAVLTDDGRGLDRAGIQHWVEQIVELRHRGIEIVLVSSGAVAEGMSRLGWKDRPEALHELQAAAAIGQMGLVQAYESCFQQYGIHTAQILLDHDDLSNRERYLNARSTMQTLIELGAVSVVNENDTVVTDEIRFGDNDTLAALVANLVDADLLIILTDQDGLFDKDPRSNPDAALIPRARAGDDTLEGMASGVGGRLGRGGMSTKVRAARLAARSGCHTVIASGRRQSLLRTLHEDTTPITLLVADEKPMAARKRWLAGQLQMRGTLVLDAGAVDVLRSKGKSLLPVGVADVQGEFSRGDMVLCVDGKGMEIARGLVNYSAEDARKIIGKSTPDIVNMLGYINDEELIHRDNLVVLQ